MVLDVTSAGAEAAVAVGKAADLTLIEYLPGYSPEGRLPQ